ncbi:hypothetical protein PHYC_02913 [Phycisphaerales bacterium]|nr:hypothetical protein PHYC_02913 [Phycisphaerales bacterium]
MTRVLALHRPARVSGVSVAGLYAAGLQPPHYAWRPMVIGECLGPDDLRRSALAEAPGLTCAAWPPGGDPVAQTLAVREALFGVGASVVVPNDLPHGFAAAALLRHHGVRCAAWLHSASHEGELLVTHCLELANAWRAVSTGVRDHTIAAAAEAGLTIAPSAELAPAFVDVPARPPPMPALPLRLLYAGRLEKHHKRVLDLSVLCDHLLAAGTPFHLCIAGEGPAEAELRQSLAPHAAAGRVSMVAPVRPSGMRSLLESHHFSLLVSASEGAPTIVMESLAAGRPAAITASCGDAASWVRDGVEGIVVPTAGMALLARKLSHAAGSPALLERLARAAHSRARSQLSARSRAPALDALIQDAAYSDVHLATPEAILSHWRRILHSLAAIGPVLPLRAEFLARAWLRDLGARALGVRLADLPLHVPPRDTPAERRLRRTLASLRQAGATRLALYAAGQHTRKVARVIEESPDIIAIIDDRAGQPSGPPAVLAERPVLPPNAYASLHADALIISSDEHERELLVRGRAFAARVVPLYDAA